MQPVRLSASALLATSVLFVGTFAVAACSAEESARAAAPAPGGGNAPSVEAQRALAEVQGRVLPGAAEALGAPGPLAIESFAVVPNPVTGKGPVLALREQGTEAGTMRMGAAQGADGRWWLPVVTDADVADVIRRVTGEAPENLPTEPRSDAYRKAMGLDD